MTQLILAYNFPAKHLAKLRMAAMKLGVKVRPVEKREYLQSLGSFVGTLGSFESVYDGENFPELMLVLCRKVIGKNQLCHVNTSCGLRRKPK